MYMIHVANCSKPYLFLEIRYFWHVCIASSQVWNVDIKCIDQSKDTYV